MAVVQTFPTPEGPVALTRMANIIAMSILGNNTAAPAKPIELTIAQALGMGGLATNVTATKTLTLAATDSYTLTATADCSVGGTNTGDVTLATNHGLALTGQVIGMGTPSTCTATSTNAVTTTTHTHEITGFITSLSGALLATGAVVGAVSQAQQFTTGVITGKIYPSSNSTTALQFNKADGTTNVLNIDTTNGRVGIGTTGPNVPLTVVANAGGEGMRVWNNSSTTGARAILYFHAGPSIGSATNYLSSIRTDGNGSQAFAFNTYDGNGTPNYGERMRIDSLGNVGIGTTGPLTKNHTVNTSATTNAVLEVMRIEAQVTSTGVGAAGFGPALTLYGESSVDATYRQMAQIDATWATATDASRKARVTLSAFDTASREIMRGEASGTAAMVGFLGASAVVRPAALTAALTVVSSTAPGTPDYAIADPVQNTGYGFSTADEFLTVMAVLANLQNWRNSIDDILGHSAGYGLLTH